MRNFKPVGMLGTCLTLMSLSLLTSSVYGYDNSRVSYLDSVSSSYIYNQASDTSSVLNSNSIDARGIEASFKLETPPVITNSNDIINLSLRNSDLRQVLRMLADKAKINIVFDESVEGKITLDLKNVTLNDAFLVIFKSSQLTYLVDGNCITVMSFEASKEVSYTKSNMTVIPVKYVNAESVADFLNNNIFKLRIFGLSNKASVTSNPRTNQIIIFGTNADVAAIKRILPVIDTKPMVNNFVVNHVTPKEMAMLLCNSLFYNGEEIDDEDSDDTDSGKEDSALVLGKAKVACRATKLTDPTTESDSSASDDSDQNFSLKSFRAAPLTISYFTDLGRISVSGGSVEQVEVIRDFIKEHDKKQLMAYVELSVVELTETGSKEFSNEWNLWTPFISLGFTPSDGLTTSSASPFFLWGSKYPTVVTSTSKDETTGEIKESTGIDYITKTNNKALTYTLKYLIENGNGKVLTNPKIMVTNGKEATIDMTSDYVKSVTSQILQGSDSVTSATQRTYDIGNDDGLLIKITPFISPDGYVSMNITPEFATIKERVYAVNDLGRPELAATLLQRRDLELKNIRIRDGETLVLAGLIKENETQSVQKMPILSDLPFIGAFFRGNSSNKSREELVIVVTPHIIKDVDDMHTNGKIYDL